MSLTDRIRAFMAPMQVKMSSIAPLFARMASGQPIWRSTDFVSYSKEGYQRNTVVYRCGSILATSVAKVPWCLYKGYGKDAKEIEDPQHPLLMLLHKPNPKTPGAAFFQGLVTFYLLHGNAYVEGVSANDLGMAVPRELWLQRPDRIKILPHPVIGNMPGAFIYELAGSTKTWQMNPIDGTGPMMHWKTFDPLDDWYGQSVIRAAATSVDQHNAAGAWNQAMLQNSGIPAGGFKYSPAAPGMPSTLTEEQRRQAEKNIEERLQGPRNARRPLIMDGNWDWINIGLPPQDMEWLEGRKANAIDICAAFGVPPQVYGVPDAQTFANYEQARLAMYEEAVIPIHDAMCDALNQWLVPAFGEDLRLVGDWDQVDALAPKRQAVWDRIAEADWLSTNEKREATGYEMLDDDSGMGDEVLVDASKQPLSMLGDVTDASIQGANNAADTGDDPAAGDNAGDGATPGDSGKPAKKPKKGKQRRLPVADPARAKAAGVKILVAELMREGVQDDVALACARLAYGEDA